MVATMEAVETFAVGAEAGDAGEEFWFVAGGCGGAEVVSMRGSRMKG
jgi:hypothetical protein